MYKSVSEIIIMRLEKNKRWSFPSRVIQLTHSFSYVEIKDETENEMKEVEVDLVWKWIKQYTNATIGELRRTLWQE